MTENVLISYLGENKPNLISEITSHLTEIGGEFQELLSLLGKSL